MPVRSAIIVLLVTGCAVSERQPVPDPCPHAQPGPPPLPPLVRPEQLRAHDAAEHAARIGTEAALALCAQRWDAFRR
jgi:hypothetical protein